MDEALLLREDRNGIARLTLNRPASHNALSQALMAALHEALDAIEADRSVHVAVLAGAGPAFCAGHDLRELRALGRESTRRCSRSARPHAAHRLFRVPVIARVHGIATAAAASSSRRVTSRWRDRRPGSQRRASTSACSAHADGGAFARGRAQGGDGNAAHGRDGGRRGGGRLGLVNRAVADDALDAEWTPSPPASPRAARRVSLTASPRSIARQRCRSPRPTSSPPRSWCGTCRRRTRPRASARPGAARAGVFLPPAPSSPLALPWTGV